jgi:ubiquinone/menaquinone biosynthesis C-methylase UbiE
MGSTQRSFIPAAGSDWLLPFYDFFTKLLGADAVHKRLLEQASIRPGDRVLEIGCGTANLAILAKRLNPTAEVVGIDPDPKALPRARKKAHHAGLQLEFREAFTEELPFPDGSIDKVLSAFMLHHIQADSRHTALREVHRVLRPGGSLLLADFEHGEHPRSHHSPDALHRVAAPRVQSGIAQLMLDAGFQEAKRVAHQGSLLGEVACYIAVR